jgi:hypothetical protein
MAAYTETISLADVTIGDGWIGISAITPTINGETPSADLTRVRMIFRLGQSTYVLDSDEGEISIDDADTWQASIAAMNTFLPRPGRWSWEMEFYRTGATAPWTLYNGILVAHTDLD